MRTGSLMIALHRGCKLKKTFPRLLDAQRIIFHSDRGTQYNSDTFRKALDRLDILQSMSGVGNCDDNAPKESFGALVKSELASSMTFRDPDEAGRQL